MLSLDAGVLVERLLLPIQPPDPPVLQFKADVCRHPNQTIRDWDELAVHDAIPYDDESACARTENAYPFSQAGLQILEVGVRFGTWTGEGVVLSDFAVASESHIGPHPVQAMAVVLMVVVGVQVWRRGYEEIDAVIPDEG